MGVVFEAEDLESGRRVALKVLSLALDSPEARQRFLREGRLAAAVNHPNSVYVFGTEEIAGTPAIAMELVAGGTLQDRVTVAGPMKPAEAVDAVLQVVAGLEAAQKAGVLHRDVKPSNCFVDAAGLVKVGDFGLSIATAIRSEPTLTATGIFMGTPAYCSPEQLRGEDLSVRSDIYSVGATLYYLLTGRTPYTAANVVALIATILEQPTPDPRRERPELPAGLARVVRSCLEKDPGQRPGSYRELRQALAPYGSAAPAPATLGFRFGANLIDLLVLNAVIMIVALAWGNPLDLLESARRSDRVVLVLTAGVAGSILYYSILEWLWGATLGKLVFRLRVVRNDRGAPQFWRTLGRAAVFRLAPLAAFLAAYGPDPYAYLGSGSTRQYVTSALSYVILALLFTTARRRNGFAALHDLATGTRVVAWVPVASRPTLEHSDLAAPALNQAARVGPYHVLQRLEPLPDGEWILGYDLRLLRKVWVRTTGPGAAPVAAAQRSLSRVGRLRWLAGRRSAAENWDAFEAPEGGPLLSLAREPQPWSQVKFWLWDLCNELNLAMREGTVPARLELDAIWITSDGRAKLLDFPAPGVQSLPGIGPRESTNPPDPRGSNAGGTSTVGLLARVATVALAGRAEVESATAFSPERAQEAQDPATSVRRPLAVHARNFLRRLATSSGPAEAAQALAPLLNKPPEVTPARRVALVAGCIIFPLFAVPGAYLGSRTIEQWQRTSPGLMELTHVLQERRVLQRFTPSSNLPTDEDFGVYISARFGSVITNPVNWKSAMAVALIKDEARAFAENSIRQHAAPTAEQVARAERALAPFSKSSQAMPVMQAPGRWLLLAFNFLALGVGLIGLAAALAFRGGLVLLIAGVCHVTRDGQAASRLRLLVRGMISWAPVLVSALLALSFSGLGASLVAATLVLIVPTIISLALPERGLPDRLAGTWPVLR